jgi:HTH-type transcriptional regulator/antitoxin HigA
MARFELTAAADRDLTEIYVYSHGRFGERKANDYLTSLRLRVVLRSSLKWLTWDARSSTFAPAIIGSRTLATWSFIRRLKEASVLFEFSTLRWTLKFISERRTMEHDVNIRPIRTDQDHRAALAEIEACWGAPQGSEQGDRLDVLIALVESYEAKRWPIENNESFDPIDVLGYAIEELGHSQSALAELLGSRSRASEILTRGAPSRST